MTATQWPGHTITTPAWWNVPLWVWWLLFGNADDGLYGTAQFMPDAPNWQRFVMWGLRNPLHNLTWYVLGVACVPNAAHSARGMDDPGWNFGATFAKAMPVGLFALACIVAAWALLGMHIGLVVVLIILAAVLALVPEIVPLPFVGHTGARWQWYAGWRPTGGAFGLKWRTASDG